MSLLFTFGSEFIKLLPLSIQFSAGDKFSLYKGAKRYELANHLGNVLSVVSDELDSNGEAIVLSAKDYYPFGMSMPGRGTEGGIYRYGFNGKETDPETALNDFGARFYAANLGRWLSLDPLAAKFPNWSPYNAMNCNPILFIDVDGRYIEIGYLNEKGEKMYFKYGGSEPVPNNDYVKTVINTLHQLKERGLDKLGVIDKLTEDKNKQVLINEPESWCARSNGVSVGINWHPQSGTITCEGKRRCPAIGLLHELGHPYYQVTDPHGIIGLLEQKGKVLKQKYGGETTEYYIEMESYQSLLIMGYIGNYDNIEDAFIIPNIDNPAAEAINNGKRYVHDYEQKYQATDPFSLEGKTVQELGIPEDICKHKCNPKKKKE